MFSTSNLCFVVNTMWRIDVGINKSGRRSSPSNVILHESGENDRRGEICCHPSGPLLVLFTTVCLLFCCSSHKKIFYFNNSTVRLSYGPPIPLSPIAMIFKVKHHHGDLSNVRY